ncbi:MAG TPA: hypothetical protein VFF05_09305, partial [Rudaea sp.]|nr:hypothetical protein [Rudaea sp.]
MQFTPRVAKVEEALLLEASASLRLWGGRRRLSHQLFAQCEPLAPARWSEAATALKALGLLRMQRDAETAPRCRTQDMPLAMLSAAREHLESLERIGCRTWG